MPERYTRAPSSSEDYIIPAVVTSIALALLLMYEQGDFGQIRINQWHRFLCRGNEGQAHEGRIGECRGAAANRMGRPDGAHVHLQVARRTPAARGLAQHRR